MFREFIFIVFSGLDKLKDRLAFRLKKRLDLLGTVQICAFRSYGSQTELHLNGRVLGKFEDKYQKGVRNTWQNVKILLKRYLMTGIPDSLVSITYQNRNYEVITNGEGYFHLDVSSTTPFDTGNFWQNAKVKVISSPTIEAEDISTTALIMTPSSKAEIAIISDIDDTIILAHSNNKLKEVFTLITKSPEKRRLCDAGIPLFYQTTSIGHAAFQINPLFYISTSSWNLHDQVMKFIKLHNLPQGAMLLKDLGFEKDKSVGFSRMKEKKEFIRRVMATYPQLTFILIGDSAKADARIYADISLMHPGRIAAIYIRDIGVRKYARKVERIASELIYSGGPEIFLFTRSEEAMKDARRRELIPYAQPS